MHGSSSSVFDMEGTHRDVRATVRAREVAFEILLHVVAPREVLIATAALVLDIHCPKYSLIRSEFHGESNKIMAAFKFHGL